MSASLGSQRAERGVGLERLRQAMAHQQHRYLLANRQHRLRGRNQTIATGFQRVAEVVFRLTLAFADQPPVGRLDEEGW